MNEKLKSPVGLALQGFGLGALLFFTVHPFAPRQADTSPAQSGTVRISVDA
jgi:hypothetical protein